MKSGEKSYIIANKIRSKLLLFIDNELKPKPKNPKQKFIKNYLIPEEKITIEYQEIKNDKNFYEFSNKFTLPFKSNINLISIKPNIFSPSTVENTPYKEKSNNFFHQNFTMRNVHQHRTNQDKVKNKIEINIRNKRVINSMNLKNNKFIDFDDNKYCIRSNKKKSSVIFVEKIIKKDENYLENLCKKLKKKKIRKNLSSVRVPKNKKSGTVCIQNKKKLKFGFAFSNRGFKHLFRSVNKKNTENKCLCKLIKNNCKE